MRTRSSLVLGLGLGLGLLASACTVGSTGPGTGDDAPDPDPDPSDGTVSGAITSDQTWTGAITLTGEVTIEAGVTVTIEPGTELSANEGVALRVRGTLEAVGTETSKISMLPSTGAIAWAGIVADPGGSVHVAWAEGTDVATLLYCHDGAILCHLDHVEFTGISQALIAEDVALLTSSRITEISNGGITVRGNGDLTVRDSYVLTSQGDLIVQNGGTLLVEYSEIGDTQGSYDHCNFHIGSAASLTITKTNIVNGVFGMMLGGTTGASITSNNWLSNDNEISEVGTNTAVDLTGNYWQNGAPALGAAYDVSSPAAAPIPDAGPRP